MFYEKFFGIFDRLRKQPLQQKKNTPRVSRSRRYQRNSCSSLEQLEPRIALSATSIAQEAEGDLPNGWGVITLDSNEDDLYLRATRQIDSFGTLREVIEYSENASFTSPGSITNFTGWYEDILVTAGTSVNYNSFGRGDDATKGASPFFTFPGAEDPSLTPNGWTVPTDDDAYHFVPGTVGGSVTLEHEGQFRTLSYIPRYLYDADDGRMGNGVDALFFNEAGVPQLEGEITLNEPSEEPGGEPTEIKITVTGNIDYDGDIRFTYKLSETERFTPSGGSHVNTFYETPIVPEGPSAVTLAAGRDFFLGLQVDLPGPDSSINIASPIVTNTANDNDIVLAASMVEVDAPITSKSNFIVTTTSRALSSDLPIGGARATVVEDFRTNTKIISPEFGVSVADDDRTALRSRAAVVVTASGGWDATRLSVRGIQSDFVFAGDVNASEQSYFLRTSSEQESFRFVTEGEGVLTGATVDVTLDNVELVSATDSVVHDVFLSTNLDSLRISAEGDNSVQTSINSSTFDIAIQEEDTLDIDAVVRTGAGFQVTAVGAVQLTSSIDSFGDVVIQSQSTVSGEAEISTVNGTVTLSGSEVAVTGGIQVLNSNYDETTTDVRLTATSGPLVFGAISATNGITLIQDSPNTLNTGVRSVGTVVGNKLDIVADGNVELATNVSEAVVVSGAAVTIDEEDDAVFSIVATGLTTLTARGVDPLGEDVNGNGVLDSGEDTNGNAVLDEGTALVATVRDTSELIVSAPKGSVEVLAVTSDVLTVGNIQSLVGFNAADTRAAGNVSIRSTQGDLVVLDAPQAGVGVLNARAASALTGNLAGTFAFNQPGITPSTITASGNGSLNDTLNLSTIFPGFDTTNRLRVRDVVLLRGQANANENGLYRITALGGQLRPWILTRTTTTSVTSGLPVNSRIAVQDGEFAGESFRVKAYGTTLNVTPLHVAAGYKRSPDEISVRAVTAAALIGNFTETDGGQIVGSSVEDVNFNGVLDPGEDVVNGVIDTEDTNGNGVIDTEDTNGNGVLDAGEDVNSNGVIDTEDTNGNGVIDTEDTNGNGVLDPGEDVVNGVLDPTPSQLIVSGVTVEDGDLILVRFGAASDVSEDLNGNGLLDDTEDTNQNGVLDLGSSAQYPSAIPNGIYQVAIDETGATPWTLTRWTRPGENSPVEEAVVVVADGFYRTSETGQTFTVNYDGLGLSALTISDPVNNSAETVQLNLGSYDPRDSVDFVVSTNGNSNTSPGSLGRMLKLVQENQAKDFNQEFVEQAIRFGNVLGGFDGITGSIELQQELPAIERAFVLDASNRYPLTTDAILPIVIDGSRITSTREGTFVVDDEINGFVYKAGATGQTGSTSPEDATRSVLRGLQMGGFESGAAVQIDSVSNVLVEDMTIGLNAEKNSQAVKYGIQITGNETGQDGPVTLLNNNIYSASISGGISNPIIGAGILIESNPGASEPTDYVQVVGGLVGQSIGSNASGIEVRTHDNVGLEDTNGNGLLDVGEDTNGNGVLDTLDGRAGNMIGANPLPAMPNLAVVQNKATVELDTAMWGTYGNDLYLGQSVSSSAFLPGTVIAFIELGNSEDANGNGVLDTEDVNGNGTLDQGEDTNSNGRLDFEDINQNGAIDFSRNVTMSERATLTNNGGQEIQFGSGQANGSRVLISNNFTGIKLQSGKVRVVNTEVRDNVLNGIEVGQDTPPADASLLEARIGDGLSSPLIQRRLAETPTSQATTLKLESVLPIAVGMNVSDSGTAIQLGTTVINVNALQNEITLSKPIGSGLQLNDELQFEGLNPKIRSDASNAILSNGQYGIRFQDSVRFLYEDANGNNILDPNEDLNDNGKLDTALRFQGNYVGKVHQGSNEPGNLRANYHAENESEDNNGNGVIDTEDTNGNGVLDAGEDVNSNGVIDTEDTNGNGVLDQVGAGLRSHPSFTSLSERTFNYSAEASQYDFGDRNNNVNSEIGVPLVATLAPTSLSWEPGRQLIRLNWIAPETNSSTGAIGGYRIQVMKGGVTWSVDTGSTTTRYDLEEFNNSSLIDGDEYQVSVAAVLVDENGSELLPPNNLSEFSSYVTAIPAQPAGAPIRRPATRF